MGQTGIGSACQRRAKSVPAGLQYVTWGCLCIWAVLLVSLPVVTQGAEQTEVEYAKGVLDYDNRNYLDALEHLRKAVELTPDNADALFYLGLTLTRLGEFPEAIAALGKVLQLEPSKRYVHYHLGLAYLQDKRYPEALAQFQLAEQFDPEKAATQFYLGYTNYLLQKYREAPPYLQRALELDTTLTPGAQYYRGLALYASERDTPAQAAFEAVVQAAPDSPEALQARRYLEALAARAREQRLAQVQGSISYEHDSNVILEPNGIEISGQADSRMVFTLLGRLQPVRTPLWRAGAEYALYQSVHYQLSEFDLQSHTAGLFASYKLDRVTLYGAANYNITYLDSRLFHNYDRFSEAVTLQPSATIREADRLFAVASVRYRTSHFFGPLSPEQDPAVRERDGWAIRTGVHQFLTFNNQQASLRLSYHYEGSRKDGTDWEYNSHEVGLGLHLPLWGGVVLDVDGSYNRFDYLHVNSFDAGQLAILDAPDQRKRSDDRWIGSVALSRALGQYLTVAFSLAHTRNFSNVAFFDYDRTIWTLALLGRY
ncbi:MAG TPA: tetratricopeptide repeat protein [Candidatus Tectomicrobia bacterium]|jgi:tetratricopeptide (TPR) repeat protein